MSILQKSQLLSFFFWHWKSEKFIDTLVLVFDKAHVALGIHKAAEQWTCGIWQCRGLTKPFSSAVITKKPRQSQGEKNIAERRKWVLTAFTPGCAVVGDD